jgi:surfeit locus 1 family protein
MILIRSINLNRFNNFRSPLIRLFSNQSTDEKITTTNRKKYNKPPPIDLKSVRTNQQQGEANENSRSSSGKINALALLSIPILTFGLGVWQVKRREEKMKLIKFLEERTKAQPMELPTNPRDLATLLEKHEYQQFKVKGKFLHSKEILLTIRLF